MVISKYLNRTFFLRHNSEDTSIRPRSARVFSLTAAAAVLTSIRTISVCSKGGLKNWRGMRGRIPDAEVW